MPSISVVMTVYNGQRFLEAAIRSIREQTYQDWELLIADDGSTDDSAAIMHAFAAQDPRIRPLFLAHGGSPHAANVAVSQARGTLFARMDQDDVALPHRLAQQLAWMQRTDVDVCGSYVQDFGDTDGFTWFPETHTAICHELLFRPALLHGTALMPTLILREHPYNEEVRFDDYELWTRLAPLYRMGNVPQVLLKRRGHGVQTHIVHKAQLRAESRRYRERYFRALFSDEQGADSTVVHCLAEKQPFASLPALKQAGAWLVRLANTPDNFLRTRMAGRWRAACLRSAQLGWGAYRLYHQVSGTFGGMVDDGDTYLFRLAFALRQPSSSRMFKLAYRSRHWVRTRLSI